MDVPLLPLLLVVGPVFDDPATRGMPFPTDYHFIPEIYHGEWSDKRSNCGRQTTKRANLVIERTQINRMPVSAVWAYSDYPAVIVTLNDGSERGKPLHFDISHNEMTLKMDNGPAKKADLLVRCPTGSPLPEASTAANNRIAEACMRRDRDGFLDSFFSSSRAQRAVLAKKITIVRGDAPKRKWPRQFYQLPPIKFAPHIAYYEYSPEQVVALKFETVDLADEGFRIDWGEEPHLPDGRIYEYEPEIRHPVGIRGRLTFKWVGRCWQLVSDEVRWSDWQ